MRIAKFIAQSGYCSRREAEKLIIEKKITNSFNLIPTFIVFSVVSFNYLFRNEFIKFIILKIN